VTIRRKCSSSISLGGEKPINLERGPTRLPSSSAASSFILRVSVHSPSVNLDLEPTGTAAMVRAGALVMLAEAPAGTPLLDFAGEWRTFPLLFM
jgi:hypothetical protein